MNRLLPGLQSVVLIPVLGLMIVAGVVLYFMVLRTVGDFADASIRADLDSLARSAFAIADAEVDRQNREGRAGDEQASRLHQLNARMRFEDFAREHEVGMIVEVNGVADFVSGMEVGDSQELLPSSSCRRYPATNTAERA